MKKIFSIFIFFLCIVVFFSCAVQQKPPFVPVPDSQYFRHERRYIRVNNIIETRDGVSVRHLPVWLQVFIFGGIEEIERNHNYRDKYVFVGSNEGVNFNALSLWAGNFTPEQDFTILAAERIERRMISAAVLYPDFEYGLFFETMVKKAYNAVYSGAVKEDTYWIKMRTDNDNMETESTEIYHFFVLISIEKHIMQAIIAGLMEEAVSAVTPTSAQQNAIIRLRQNFFEGF